jgi:glycosyltransferase involved in cell wall biosynthesis
LVTSLASLGVVPGVPRILTVHQLPWFVSLFLPKFLRSGIEALLWAYGAWLYRRFTAIVTPSQMIADLVARHTQAKPTSISNGVDTVRFNPNPTCVAEAEALREKYSLDSQLPIILYAGRVDADKQVDLVMRAAALAMQHLQAQLLIVGDGKQLVAIKKIAEDLGIQSQSRFTGFVPVTGDLPGLYRLASVFITASEVEIQSSVVLEAAASGLPVVTVHASSMPEFVQDGLTGYLVPPKDTAALAARIVKLLQNPEQARSMGQAALEIAQAHSHAAAVTEHIQFYESLLKSRL